MAFPKRLLADHERLVLDLRPHWVALVLDSDDLLDQLEQLARLKFQGHITDEEYETQKRRLLGRL